MTKIKLTLPGVPPSWNKMRPMHWAKYAEIKKEWELLTLVSIPKGVSKTPFQKVSLSVTCYVKNNLRDPDNLFIKPIIDALNGRLLVADTGKCIREIKIKIRPADKSAEHTEVVISPI